MAQQETTNDPPIEPSHPPPVASSQTEVDEATSKMKRKGMKPRSAVWDHFTKFVDGSGKFENAFDRYATIDPCFKLDLQSGDGLLDCLIGKMLGEL
ncbi:hypothetical protein GH714_014239 [Hevea brasiliensis]|uniref:Uncharacterized protein n=1 Tax=Hevea brasiliensis TaxID=3981 RepID=A0A6A6LJD3_HEVBR|nr:hypothetical protein GH714_014239 [Hevea brasiliensis]